MVFDNGCIDGNFHRKFQRKYTYCIRVDMSNSELATGYAALILADEGLEITADKLQTLTKAAGIEVESIWTQLFAKALEGKDVKDMLLNVGGIRIISMRETNSRFWCWCCSCCWGCWCCCGWCCSR